MIHEFKEENALFMKNAINNFSTECKVLNSLSWGMWCVSTLSMLLLIMGEVMVLYFNTVDNATEELLTWNNALLTALCDTQALSF
jgi:hypothetical protein